MWLKNKLKSSWGLKRLFHVPVNLDQLNLKSAEVREAKGCSCRRETLETSADRGWIWRTRGMDAASKLFKVSRSFTQLLKNSHYKSEKNFLTRIWKSQQQNLNKQTMKNNKNTNSFNKLCHRKKNGRKSLNNLNYRVFSSHCFLEQIYHRLHAQLITGTQTHLRAEQRVLLAFLPLRQRRMRSAQQQWLLWFSEQQAEFYNKQKKLWSPSQRQCERIFLEDRDQTLQSFGW